MTSRIGIRGRDIELFAQFLDSAGNPTDTDDIPKVELIDSNGNVVLKSTNLHTTNTEIVGLFKFSFTLPLTMSDGYATDNWSAVIGGESVNSSFSFLVLSSGSIESAKEPVHEPGDDHDFIFTKEEAENINKLLSILKKRLKNDGKVKVPDGAGGFALVDCPIFSNSELTCFLINSLSEFNQTPHFTEFTFADNQFCTQFADILIQGAFILALAAQALIERGREFTITDNGVSFQPPQVSEILNSQFSTHMQAYREKLKFIKVNMKPSALGLGTFRVTAVNPNFLRLRHLRSRQIL